MDPASVQPACALCHVRPTTQQCQCEGDALRIAIQQALDIFIANSPQMGQASHWVTERAKEQIHHDFERLKAEAVRVYQDTVASIPCYEMYVQYRGRPPMPEHRIAGIAYQVRAAENELLAAIDDAWGRCVVEYPRWLDYFWTQVRFVPPPPPAPPQREERDRVMGRRDGRDGRDGRRRSRRDSVLTEHGRGRNLDHDTDIRYLDM